MAKKEPTRLENAVARMNEAQDALNKAHAECIASEYKEDVPVD